MLVDVELKENVDDIVLMFARVGNRITKLATGIYQCNHLNFNFEVETKLKKSFESAGYGSLGSYGVCDNYEQILEKYDFSKDPRKVAISLCKIRKADQSSSGGWRWHKWGSYIGTQKPEYEYLYDEETIDEVLVYDIHEIR